MINNKALWAARERATDELRKIWESGKEEGREAAQQHFDFMQAAVASCFLCERTA